MISEFKIRKTASETIYVLEDGTSGGTSSGAIASIAMPVGAVIKRTPTKKKSFTKSVSSVAEEGKTMSRIAKGNEKYGKDGMRALAKAGRDGASERKLDAIRNKHDNYNEEWSKTYKSSINCSHPKGFSQKAHCAGKKKHTESIMTMEDTCPDCGKCQTHGDLNEIKKGAKDSNGFTSCWSGYHAAGTKKSATTGKSVRNCVPNEGVDAYTARLQEALDNKIVNSPPPRNFVAKNAKTAGSGAHSDKSKTIPRHEKHKTNFKESEGSPEGMPHVSKKLLQHIVQQIGTDGVKALIKSLKWGDGAAGELLTLITQNLKKSAQEMKESSLQEKIPAGADVDYYIKDFSKSNAPQFKNKTAEKKKRMAIAAYYASKQK